MENIFTSGNEIVDQSAQLNISGNIIPQACLKALSLIHGHKRESSAKKKRVCLT